MNENRGDCSRRLDVGVPPEWLAEFEAADAAVREHNLGQAKQVLRRHIPPPGETDLRGVEWRYLWLKCRANDVFSLKHKSRVNSSDISPDGRWIASESDGVHLWQSGTWKEVMSPGELKIEPRGERALALNRDGSLLAALNRDANVVTLWHVPSRSLRLRHTDADQPYSVALSPDGLWMMASA